jgi:hypothetical protein
MVLVPTSCGQPTHLLPHSASAVAAAESFVVGALFPEFWGHDEAVSASLKPLSMYCNLRGSPSVLLIRDSARIRSKPEATDNSITITTYLGRRVVTAQEYTAAVDRMRPCAAVQLHDDIPFAVGKNRCRTAVDRAVSWLAHMVEHCKRSISVAHSGVSEAAPRHATEDAEAAPKAVRYSGGGVPTCPILAYMPSVREDAAQAKAWALIPKIVQEANAWYSQETGCPGDLIPGFLIGGTGHGEDEPTKWGIVERALGHLPIDKLRICGGFASPHDILTAISLGVDVLDSDVVSGWSERGFAVTFSMHEGAPKAPLYMDLADSTFAEDCRRICEGCTCVSCGGTPYHHVAELASGLSAGGEPRPYLHRGHSRAYINHLLNTKEMLYKVLLQAHNLHHVAAFMRVIRAEIVNGSFERYKSWFGTEYPVAMSVC